MQSLVLPPSSFITPEFGHSRLDPGPERLPFDLNRSINARRCNPRDLPLPRSMSASVPAEDPQETSGNIRRPGQPELPQPVTAVESSTVSTPTGLSSAGLTGHIRPPRTPPPTTTIHEPAYYRVISGPGSEVPRQPFPVSDSFTARLPPSLSVPATSQPPVPPFSQSTFGTSPPGAAGRALPQKPTRRTKAHVASACVNCKKKHLGCDPARPCRRCVLSGKEATCVDVTHKKRGRPPLKAEDASLRTYTSQADNSGSSGEQHASQSRRPMHRATSSRELRPMTDLQIPGGTPGPFGMRVPAGQLHRWPGAVYPQTIDPSLQMQRNMGHRRFSSSSSVQSMTSVSPGSFLPIGGGYSPVMGASHMPMGPGRPLSSYGNPAVHTLSSPPQYHQPYGVPYSPYTPNTRVVNRMSMNEQPVPRDPRESFVESSVRLPPIYPPTIGNPNPGPQAHRLSDPYPATWSPQTREELVQQEPRQLSHGHGTIESISPSGQMRPAASDFTYGSQIPRQLVQIPPTQEQPHQRSPVRVRDDPPAAEAETDGSRPAKRRKMALDDMVND